jgi:hypothetical protein
MESNLLTYLAPIYHHFHKIAKCAKIAQAQVEMGREIVHAKRSESAD